jgi:hypothetical protein
VSHERVWDGILAVRCWRDLDSAEEATDLEMRDRAVAQLDRALLHGVARLVMERTIRMDSRDGDLRAADWAFLQILGPVLSREAAVRDADRGARLDAEWAKSDSQTVLVDVILSELLALFPCT